MTTRYKYICFEQSGDNTWLCRSTRDKAGLVTLGTVEYYRPWHTWTFVTTDGIVLDTRCVADIADFLGRLTLCSNAGADFEMRKKDQILRRRLSRLPVPRRQTGL